MPHAALRSLAPLLVLLPLLAVPLAGAQRAQAPPPPAAVAHVHGEPSGFLGQMGHSMAVMEREMRAAPMTGDPDHDFAAMMIPHHQGAIDMARLQLAHGKDPVLRRLAQEIIVSQGSEIAAMNLQLARRGEVAVEPIAALGSIPLAAAAPAAAPAAPQGAPGAPLPGAAIPDGTPVSARDRVYSADQTSNTVSVIEPTSQRLLGVIRLGDPVPAALSALYKGQLLVHGLGYSPDHRTLAVVSIGSNSVSLVDTATNRVRGVVYVGRSPHEAFFTPDGRELWVSVRGEDYLSVVDPVALREVRRIPVVNGPGMVMFRPDGRYAFVCSSFVPTLSVVDVQTRAVVARVPQPSPFCPNIAVSPDGQQVWFTLKDTGKVAVLRAAPPFEALATLDTGPFTNHVSFADGARGKLAYVSVGGLNAVKVYERREQGTPPLVASIPTGDLPHGLWASGDGSRVYVALENGGAVQAIDTQRQQVVATIPVGQTSQALVYVPGAVPSGAGTQNLVPLGEAGKAVHLHLVSPDGGSARATVAVNALGATDLLQVVASGLRPGATYELLLRHPRSNAPGAREVLATLKANAGGAAVAQFIGPVRSVVAPEAGTVPPGGPRSLVLTEPGKDPAVLVQARGGP